ncbi:MAG: hypothetical protein AAB217_01930, partial [Chloroflexota bacterium]
MAYRFTMIVDVVSEESNFLYQTSDSSSTQIGRKIADHMGVTPGASRVYYYRQTSIYPQALPNGSVFKADIVTVVEKQNTTFAVRMPDEADHAPIPAHARLWFRRDFAANFLPPFVSEDGVVFLSEPAIQLIDALVDMREARQAFYGEFERPGLLKEYGVEGKEAELLLAIDRKKAWLFFSEVDMIAADERHRDDANYILFDVDEEFGLPDPEWVGAARRYVSRFRANFGHYTTDARIYKRVLVVGRGPLSSAMQRALVYLNNKGVNARSLTAADARDFEAKLEELIKSN